MFLICSIIVKGGYEYIMGSRSHEPFVGVTAHLFRCMHQHCSGSVEGFTRSYSMGKLLWCEPHDDILGPIAREKQIKRLRREKRLARIERSNPKLRNRWSAINRWSPHHVDRSD